MRMRMRLVSVASALIRGLDLKHYSLANPPRRVIMRNTRSIDAVNSVIAAFVPMVQCRGIDLLQFLCRM